MQAARQCVRTFSATSRRNVGTIPDASNYNSIIMKNQIKMNSEWEKMVGYKKGHDKAVNYFNIIVGSAAVVVFALPVFARFSEIMPRKEV